MGAEGSHMHNLVRVFSLCAALVVAFAIWAPRPAIGGPGDGTSSASWDFRNQSDRAVWVTVYWSYKSQATWHIYDKSGNRPRCVLKGASWSAWSGPFNHPSLGPQIRFRTQVMNAVNCNNGEVANRQTQADIGAYKDARYYVTLTGSNGSYSLSLK
jgi:hypothetical protein